MTDRPKTFFTISTDVLSQHGKQFANIEKARGALAVGETLVQAIAAIETNVIEYRIRERVPGTFATTVVGRDGLTDAERSTRFPDPPPTVSEHEGGLTDEGDQ